MTIKRVVNTQKIEVKEKYPEFDRNKIYVCCSYGKPLYLTDTLDNSGENLEYRFKWLYLDHSVWESRHKTFESAIKKYDVYILDNQEQLARFILGCREFPKLEKITKNISVALKDDEASIDNVKCYHYDDYNIYAVNYCNQILTINYDIANNIYRVSGYDHISNDAWIWNNLKEAIVCISKKGNGQVIYEFSGENKQEEFLKWSLEQVTGKEFYNVHKGEYYQSDRNLEILY